MIYICNKTVNSEFKIMKKFFIAICFCFLLINNIEARITPLQNYSGSLQASPRNSTPTDKIVSYDEFSSFVKESFSKSIKVNKSAISTNNTSVIPGIYRQTQIEEKNKSIFEKIYDNAMKRISDSQTVQRNDVATKQLPPLQDIKRQRQQWNQPDVPTLSIKLPPYQTISKVPAVEHIPYMMTAIEVLNNGLVKMEETIVIIANAEKLRYGLTKILPAAIYPQTGKKQTLDYSLVRATINDQPIDYKFVSLDNYIGLIPDDEKSLASGVYTYKFEYLVDNLLIDNDNNYSLAWNIGGYGWNMVVDRLGATLILPQQNALIDNQILLGSPNNLHNREVSISKNGISGTAYIAKRPLFIGEGMYLSANIDKSAIIPFGLWQKFMHAFYTYGDVITAVIGCLFISLALLISWFYIKHRKNIQKIILPKTPAMIRYLLYGKFDIISACSFLLDVYKKNIIDIQQSDETILLIKRTDNLKNLSKIDQSALQKIFPQHETIFNVNKNNKLVFNRFINTLRKSFRKQISSLKLKLIAGYALINFAMLLLTEAVIAYFKISSSFVFGILALVSVICGIFLMFWNLEIRLWLKTLLRLLIIDVCICGLILMSAVVSPIAAAIIILTEIIIITALHYYTKRNGLISYYIQDVKDYRDNLIKNADNITLGKSFLNYQASILAFELNKELEPIKKEEYYKIPIMENICNIMK